MRRTLLAIVTVTAACAAHPRPDRSGSNPPPGALQLTSGPPSRPSALSDDPLWQRAARGDPIDLARLADHAGAAELLEGVDAGGTLALTALLALPYAEDAEIALGTLCARAERAPPGQLGPLLGSIDGVLHRPIRATERLDAAGLVACRNTLSRLKPPTPEDSDRLAASRALLEEWLAPK